MQRRPALLVDGEYDVLVIGAGAFGAAAARDAALRGLRTALVERGDFGGATSAECFKMVHGGIRYLQHGDLARLRASCHERSALLRIAPHLVRPLPIAIPTYGSGRRGRALLGAGACLYDLLTADRNRGIADPRQKIRRSRILGRQALLTLFPHLRSPDLSGAVVFEDGQMHNPARLVLSFVQAAVAAGATACNHLEAQGFLWDGPRVSGVKVRDRLGGDIFDIRARLTLNATGPWADYLHAEPEHFRSTRRGKFSRDAYFIVDRPSPSGHGVAIQGRSRDKDAILGRSTRHLFVAPWQDKTLVGVWHRLFPDSPDTARVEPAEVHGWIEELNSIHPALDLSASEVTFANCGLVPFGDTATSNELSFGKESRITDHRRADGTQGLVSLVGIRFTTARADAARALDLLLQQHPHPPPAPATDHLPLPGGNIEDFAAFEAHAQSHRPTMLSPATLTGLLRNHGSRYLEVIGTLQEDEENASLVPGTNTTLAEIGFAMEHEMAVRLEDVVLRRTDIAGGAHPGSDAIELVAATMARRLDWSRQRMEEELAATYRTLARHLAREPGLRRTAHGQGEMAGATRRPFAQAWTHREHREETRPSAARVQRTRSAHG